MGWWSSKEGMAAGRDPITDKVILKNIKNGKATGGHGKKPPAPKSQADIRKEQRGR